MLEIVQGLKFETDFHSKMSACRHELGTPNPQPPTILTLPLESDAALIARFHAIELLNSTSRIYDRLLAMTKSSANIHCSAHGTKGAFTRVLRSALLRTARTPLKSPLR